MHSVQQMPAMPQTRRARSSRVPTMELPDFSGRRATTCLDNDDLDIELAEGISDGSDQSIEFEEEKSDSDLKSKRKTRGATIFDNDNADANFEGGIIEEDLRKKKMTEIHIHSKNNSAVKNYVDARLDLYLVNVRAIRKIAKD